MKDDYRDYPIVVLQDRYGGCYSGGAWVAIANWTDERFTHVADGISGGDIEAASFVLPHYVAVGNTPDEAVANLLKRPRPTEPR